MIRISTLCLLVSALCLSSCGGGSGGGSAGPGNNPNYIGSQPESISKNTTHDATLLYSDGNKSGEMIAVWTVDTGNLNSDLWANIYIPGTGWLGPHLIVGSITPLQIYVAMSDSGDAVILWSELSAGIQSASYISGVWNPASTLAANGISPYLVKSRTATELANVVWTDNTALRTLYISSFQSLTGWQTAVAVPAALSTETSAPAAYDPRIGSDTAGDIYLTWWAAGGFRQNIDDAVLGWSGVSSIATTNTRTASLAVNPSGSALLAWQEQLAGGGTGLDVSNYISSSWSAPTNLTIFSGLVLNNINTVLQSDGSALLTWDEISPSDSTVSNIHSLAYSATAGWSKTAGSIPSGQLSSLDASTINSNISDVIATAWAGTGGIFASLYNLSNTWSDALPIESDSAESPELNLTVSSAQLVWLEAKGSVTQVWFASWTL